MSLIYIGRFKQIDIDQIVIANEVKQPQEIAMSLRSSQWLISFAVHYNAEDLK